LAAVMKKFKGASQKVRRAQILSKADADGPNWTDRRFGDVRSLRAETKAWSSDANGAQRGVDWQMKIGDARCKLTSVYPKIRL
jgi:hypothetical protein